MSESRSVADTAEAAAEICFWPVAEDRIVHPRVGSLGLTGHGSGAIATAACGPFGESSSTLRSALCHKRLSPSDRSFDARNFERGREADQGPDRNHSEKARMVRARGWPGLLTTWKP